MPEKATLLRGFFHYEWWKSVYCIDIWFLVLAKIRINLTLDEDPGFVYDIHTLIRKIYKTHKEVRTVYRLKTIYNDYSTCCYDFILGIDCLSQRAVDRAASHFSQACEKTPRRHYNYMKYQSYLGLTHVLRGHSRGLELCQQAIKYGEAEGDLYMNLARAQWFQKQRVETLLTLEAGLVVDAEHTGLHQMRKQLGVRRFTPLPFLPRQHFLNAWLGRKLRKK